jgi:hypothetical protein
MDDLNAINAQYTPKLPISFVDYTADSRNFFCIEVSQCKTLIRGVKHVANYGTVRISAGNYAESMLINRPMTLEAADGAVNIGQQ